ncbi:hypothetical protein [Phenylobacterium sp.]|uniref:hypothetical protein n=1 Tax=Phenylobacterium sp. TaxID=1871053 RepID=UPI0025FF806C|nr:hypothetical protein [Phenylobacterium sp.]
MTSTLKPPPKAALERFHVGQVGDDTVETYLAKGWSLAICCKGCARLVEWTPPQLLERFGDRPRLRIAALVERLACGGDGGCGSREIAVFPHLYDAPWTWPG